MLKSIIYYAVFFSINNILFGQSIIISEMTVDSNQEGVVLNVIIKNNSKTDYLFLKPLPENICGSFLNISFKSGDKKYEWFPCRSFDNIGQVILNNENSLVLKRNEEYKISYLMKYSDFTPYPVSGTYHIAVNINYADLDFKTDKKVAIFDQEINYVDFYFEIFN